MSASADERRSALAPVIEAARAHVAELETRAQAMGDAAHRAYVAGDDRGGSAAHEIAEQAKRDLEAAQAKLATLLGAEQVISHEQTREQWQRQLADARQRETIALDERDAQLATVPMAVSAAKESIKRARAAEEDARHAQRQRLELEAALRGETNLRPPDHSRVTAVVDSSALLTTIERSTEF